MMSILLSLTVAGSTPAASTIFAKIAIVFCKFVNSPSLRPSMLEHWAAVCWGASARRKWSTAQTPEVWTVTLPPQ